jgi:hypothetical protein
MGYSLKELVKMEAWNQNNLDWQISTKHSYPSRSPVYTIDPKDLNNGESVLLKIPVELNIPNKTPHEVQDEEIPDLLKSISQYMSRGVYIKPYTSYLFDGVLLVTNKRFVFRFVSNLIEYNCEYPLLGTTCSLMNKMYISTIMKKEIEVDPEKSPYLQIGDLKLWLLEGFEGNKSGGFYTFARYSVYKSFFEALEFVKHNGINGDDIAWRRIVKYLYFPDKQNKLSGNIVLLLVILLLGGFVSMFLGGFLFEKNDFAVNMFLGGFLMFGVCFFALFIYSLIFAPMLEKRLQIHLAKDDPTLSQYLNK